MFFLFFFKKTFISFTSFFIFIFLITFSLIIKPYLKDIINNLKKFNSWKIQLTIAYNFISSIDNDEDRVMDSKSGNTELMISDEEDKVIKELFDSLKNRYQNNSESIKAS